MDLYNMTFYYGITGLILDSIDDLFRDCWTRTIVNNVASDWMAQTEGLGEGKIISVILNLLYLCPIFDVIVAPDRFKLILYVDDVVLYSIFNTIYKREICWWLQREIDALVEWLRNNNMRFSIKKTRSITFYSNHIQKRYPQTIIDIKLYLSPTESIIHIKNITESVKYLGYHLTLNLDPSYHVNIVTQRVAMAFIYVKKMVKNIPGLLAINHMYLVKATVLSIIEYHYIYLSNAPQSKLRPLIVLYHRILRYLSGTLTSTPLELIYWLSTLPDLMTTIRGKSAKWWMRNMTLSDNNPLYGIIENLWFIRWKRHLFYDENGKYRLRGYSKKSILWKSFVNAINYEMLNIYMIKQESDYVDYHQDLKYLPIAPILPENVRFVMNEYTEYASYNFNISNLFVFCDGSLKNFEGGIGIYIESHDVHNAHYFSPVFLKEYEHYVGKQYDINIVELLAIKQSIYYLVTDIQIDLFENIYIITDNEQCIQWILGRNRIRQQIVSLLINNIYNKFKKLSILKNKTVYFVPIKRGKWRGNIRADRLAKNAVITRSHFLHNTKQQIVSKNAIKTHLKVLQQQDLYNDMEQKQDRCRSWFIHQTKIYRHYLIKDDFKMLTLKQLATINQLRTGHIKINAYFYYQSFCHRRSINIQSEKPLKCILECCSKCNGGYCIHCEVFEDVHHFLFQCQQYIVLRTKYINTIFRILHWYQIQISMKAILFPPKNMSWKHRKMVLYNICKYVQESGRLR